jgi:isochorismate hydrolase
MMMNFKTIMVEDALSALTEFEHVNALCNWKLMFGDVLDVDQVTARLTLAAADVAA